MRRILLLFIGLAVAAISPMIQTGSAAGQPHSVNGTGFVVEGGLLPYRTSIAAVKPANGRVNGATTTDLDLSELAPDIGRVHFETDVDCLAVDGSEAWVGGTVRHSTFEPWVGLSVVIYVSDGGKHGTDAVHGAFVGDEVPEGTTCEDKPDLGPNEVLQGNITVR